MTNSILYTNTSPIKAKVEEGENVHWMSRPLFLSQGIGLNWMEGIITMSNTDNKDSISYPINDQPCEVENRISFHGSFDAVERDIDDWRKSQVWWD